MDPRRGGPDAENASVRGERVHVEDPGRAQHLICEHRNTGLRSVPLSQWRSAEPLCRKCGRQVKRYELLETTRLGPHPGVQNLFEWGKDY